MSPALAQLLNPAFLAPGLAIAGAVAVSIPIIIHILSRRPRKPEPWAAMRFLLAAYKRHRMRTRLEQLLLLATRCLLALLIGLALAGPILAALGVTGLGDTGRTIVLIFDNSLTSAAKSASAQRRHDALKTTADKLLAELGPADRIALVSAARPAQPLVSPPIHDPGAIRRQIDLLEPVEAAADLPAAFAESLKVIQALDNSGGQSRQGQVYVVLVSDLSQGAVPSDKPLPEELQALGAMAKLVMVSPMASSDNVQVASLEPDRRVVVADLAGATPTVSWTLKLHRFSEAAPGDVISTVRLQAPEAAPIRRNVTWEPGQREAELVIDTPLPQTGLISVEAALEPMLEGADALPADNTRQSLVRVRQKLVVGLIGRRGITEEGLGPRRWLTTVLAPVGDRLGWPIELREFDAGTLTAEQAAELDAAFILRPDLLSDTGWDALEKWTEAGGLAWFFPPAEPSPGLWPQQIADRFGLEWSVTLDPIDTSAADGTPLRLNINHVSAEELSRLRADLPDLLGPIQVYRRLPIDSASLGAQTEVLIAGSGNEPLLIGAPTEVGRGRVLLSAMAVDVAWTNLPIKPLFVPLTHEVLRAAIDRLQPVHDFHPGDQPQLGPTWANATRLTGPDGKDLLLVTGVGGSGLGVGEEETGPARPGSPTPESASPTANLQPPGSVPQPPTPNPQPHPVTVRPIRPFPRAGLYRSETDALVVNIDAPAADTIATPEGELDAWLEPLGEWTTVPAADPGAAMRSQAEVADLTWPLLWAVLVLALLETFLARWTSHASTTHRTEDALNVKRAAA